jgi:hypothetical protein
MYANAANLALGPTFNKTKQRSYYNRTVHGSLRQAQKFLGKKINELGAYIERWREDSVRPIP